jgi:hypothetical protein
MALDVAALADCRGDVPPIGVDVATTPRTVPDGIVVRVTTDGDTPDVTVATHVAGLCELHDHPLVPEAYESIARTRFDIAIYDLPRASPPTRRTYTSRAITGR